MRYDDFGPNYTIEQLEGNLSLEDILSEYSPGRRSYDAAEAFTRAPNAEQYSMYDTRKVNDSFIDVKEKQASHEAPTEEFVPEYPEGRRKKPAREYSYGGRNISREAEEDYAPVAQPDHYAKDEEEGEEPELSPRERRELKKTAQREEREKQKREKYDFEDERRYARLEQQEQDDFEQEQQEGFFPRSLKEYVLTSLTSLVYRLRGGGGTAGVPEGAGDMEEEYLGPEVKPLFASKYYGAAAGNLKLRLKLSLVFLIVIAWISLGLPVSGKLKANNVAGLLCMGNQFMIMLLGLDVVTNAITKCFRLKPGADTMAVLACIATSIDAIYTAKTGASANHLPLCLFSSLSLMGVIWSSYLSAKGLRKAMRVAAIGKKIYAVTAENRFKSNESTILKSLRSREGFIHRAEEATPDELLFGRLFFPVLIADVIFTLAVTALKKAPGDFVFIFSAFLCAGAPFTALVSFALPYCTGSLRIFSSGAAVAGWGGCEDIGTSRNLIITDADLFPEGSVELENVRVFAGAAPEKIIGYAGTLMTACGSGTAKCFSDLMAENKAETYTLETFECLPGGGMKGIMDGHTVICGSSDLMQLMNVKIPFRLVNRHSILLSVDGTLYGIFNVKYTPLPKIREALVELIRSNRHPVFATRDFNINPEMLHNCFDLATDGYDFPPYSERFAITDVRPDAGSRISAIVCREGLGPLVRACDTGRSIYVAAKAGNMISAIAAAVTILFVLVSFLALGSLSIKALAVLAAVFSLPVIALGKLLYF